MAKKKKETCPYCGKSFAYLSRHKCKIKERIEGPTEDKSDVERRIERIEETKKMFKRSLKKDEKIVLDIINKQRSLIFDELLKLTNKKRSDLENILEVLAMQSKIKLRRELIDSSWTKNISAIEDYSDEVAVKSVKINKNEKGFIWNLFSRQPCFICPFIDKCNDTNIDNFNPHHCIWLTDWINSTLEKKEFNINFDEIEDRFEV
ncbi:MAG: hypothetical protein ACFFAH_15410 [Promethearchaeota archaeon]